MPPLHPQNVDSFYIILSIKSNNLKMFENELSLYMYLSRVIESQGFSFEIYKDILISNLSPPVAVSVMFQTTGIVSKPS